MSQGPDKHRSALPGFLKNRRTVQLVALILANVYFLNFLRFLPCGYLQCSNCVASTFTCPLILFQRGAVMASTGMLSTGIGAKVIASMAAGLAMLMAFGAALGSWACGWLCPFGFIQDIVYRIRALKFRLPLWSGHLRIPLFVALGIALPYLTRSLFFCDICPSGTVNRLWQQAAGIPLFFKTPEGIVAMVSIGVLLLITALSVFTSRPFCTILCPIGGLHGSMNRISGMYLKVDRDGCRDCGLCQTKCPQGIDPSKEPSHSLCTRCLECTRTCRHIKLDIRI